MFLPFYLCVLQAKALPFLSNLAETLQVDLQGRVGCWKAGAFHRLEGLRVSIYEYDIKYDDFMNSSVTNSKGEFAIFARDSEFLKPEFYVWMSLSCTFILRENIFGGCTKKLSKESLRLQCMKNAEHKLLFARRFLYLDELIEAHECDMQLDIGEFVLKTITNNDAPQNQLLEDTFQGNLGPKRPTCVDDSRVKMHMYGTVGCWNIRFMPLRGLRVVLSIRDIPDADYPRNATVTNAYGEFDLVGDDNEALRRPEFYVWIAISCEFVLRENLFAMCESHETLNQQCMGNTEEKYLYTEKAYSHRCRSGKPVNGVIEREIIFDAETFSLAEIGDIDGLPTESLQHHLLKGDPKRLIRPHPSSGKCVE